jgi:hypothetical protein
MPNLLQITLPLITVVYMRWRRGEESLAKTCRVFSGKEILPAGLTLTIGIWNKEHPVKAGEIINPPKK